MVEIQITRYASHRAAADGDLGEGTDGFYYVWVGGQWRLWNKMIDGFDAWGMRRGRAILSYHRETAE